MGLDLEDDDVRHSELLMDSFRGSEKGGNFGMRCEYVYVCSSENEGRKGVFGGK